MNAVGGMVQPGVQTTEMGKLREDKKGISLAARRPENG
jgi:hypothetical protein